VGQYHYDALSRRVQKIANPVGSSTTTLYFYDNERIVEEQNSGGTTQATYVYGNYVDEPLTMDRGGQTYYYHQNALFSVAAITDASGTPVERYSYDAYGAVSVTTGAGVPVPANAWGAPHSAIGNPWTFTGRQIDEEAGLYFYRARYYDAAKGRFVQRDPLVYVDGMNLYQYVRSRPTRVTDPDGLGGPHEEIIKRILELAEELADGNADRIQGEIDRLTRNLRRLGGPPEEVPPTPPSTPTPPPSTPPPPEGPPSPPAGWKPPAWTPAAVGAVVGALYWKTVNWLLENQINSIVESTKSGSGCCECYCIHPDLSKPASVRSQYFGQTEDVGRASGPTQCALLCIRATPAAQPLWRFHRCVY
jgi:RHS repeat-associated protein